MMPSIAARASAPPGWVAPPIFCGSALNAAVIVSRGTAPVGRKIPAPSPATCVAYRLYLRALGFKIAFRREGRAGSRVIRMRSSPENTVSTVSSAAIVDLEPTQNRSP